MFKILFYLYNGLVSKLQLFVYVVVMKKFIDNLFSLNMHFLSSSQLWRDYGPQIMCTLVDGKIMANKMSLVFLYTVLF